MFNKYAIKKTSNPVSDVEQIRQIGLEKLNSISHNLHDLTEEESSHFSGGVTPEKTDRRVLGSVMPIEEIGF